MKPAIQPNTHNALTPRLVETHQTLDEVTMWQQTQPLVTWCTEDEVDLAEIRQTTQPMSCLTPAIGNSKLEWAV